MCSAIESGSHPGSDFSAAATTLYDRVVKAIQSKSDIKAVIDASNDCVYLKTADGQILFSNAAYEALISGAVTPVGRYSDAFLNGTTKPVSASSDALIVSGCIQAEFEHPGRDVDGRDVMFRTFKKSLLGVGHPNMAIFGVTRIVAVLGQPEHQKILDLARSWNLFQALDARDREIAKLVAQGEKPRAIAAKFEVSEKTVENRRNAALKALSLDSPIDLIKLLVRLQDNGFCDFGL